MRIIIIEQMRGCHVLLGLGYLNIIMWAKTTYYDPTFTVPKQIEAAKELAGIN